MTQLERSRLDPIAEPQPQRGSKLLAHPLVRTLVVVLIGGVSLLVYSEVRTLWREYEFLRQEVAEVNRSAVVGYPGISPEVTFAQRPRAWYRQEGDSVLLWARWIDRKGHHWYRAALGDVDPATLSVPHPVAIAIAIDYPTVETDGGKIWRAMPDDVKVVGGVLAGRQCAYPLPVLMRVEVVNDVVDERPFLVTASVVSAPENAFAIFDATLDGRRVTMAPSGYYHGHQPILYDRKTESLWMEQEDNLTAIAGALKGKKLARVARPVPVAWSSWRSSNPRSRLVVGGDRTLGTPTE
jgi:hypothetical protein